MNKLPDARRAACPICMRPQRTCICRWITPVAHKVEVVILQHPHEQHNAKGSARLLHLSLPQSRLVVGEVFMPDVLHALLHAPFPAPQAHASLPASGRQAILLYPDMPEGQVLPMAKPPALAPALLHEPAQLRLIVLDGTWRKSRKMLYVNPLLQQLPRLPLTAVPPSRYRIRKAHHPHQLSTLEASCYALMQLERDSQQFQPLLQAFDGFVMQQAGYRSHDPALPAWQA